jgi:hypothetical protein
VRVCFAWDERKPGFFEFDTVCCGASSSGKFTVTLTGVYSGWTIVRALRNCAHRWIKETVAQTVSCLPYPLRGIDSDNVGEFINEQLLTCVMTTMSSSLGAALPQKQQLFC